MSSSHKRKYYLGFDVGSVSMSYVLLDQQQRIVQSDYQIHRGNIFNLLAQLFEHIDLTQVRQIAYNHKASDFFHHGIGINEQIAIIEAVKHNTENVGSIFSIGGETFGLILFDEQGRYQKYISNSSCAAGTGAFLDQQAERLGLADSSELSQLAESFHDEPPKIATRCAVFAKTDLIHCQQQGYSIEAISAGLSKGLAQNITDTLIKGIELRAPVVVVGGVSKNHKVMHYLSEIIGLPIQLHEQAVLASALGCALIASNRDDNQAPQITLASLLKTQIKSKHYFYPPLALKQSVFPNFEDHQHYTFDNVEVDEYNLPQPGSRIPVFMGIDIGSTSTKTMIMEADSNRQTILVGLYTRTMGQPIKATQSLFKMLRKIESDHQIQFEFIRVGTTGSGRKFIQKVINADLAVDEITAHAKAAYSLNPKVDTIIEIGGQDSKFTILKDGQVTFSVMNYVCAAGTGSFIEEQAKRLNVTLNDYAQQAIGASSPLTSDRCTVFMERDLNHFLSQGYSRQELLAAVLHSVRDNYLSKVAHLNKIGNIICFQGATAKNHALVMAFEQKLQKPIFVSRYCHLTGALGVCLLLNEEFNQRINASEQTADTSLTDEAQLMCYDQKSNFRGIDFYKESPKVVDEICDGCKNHCKLKKIEIADNTIVWGYLCGREDETEHPKFIKQSGFNYLSQRRRMFDPDRALTELSLQLKKNKSFLEDLKNRDFDFSLEKLRNMDLAFSLDKLKNIDFASSFDKLKNIDLASSLDKLRNMDFASSFEKLRQFDFDFSLDKFRQSVGFNILNLRHRLFTLQQGELQTDDKKITTTIGVPNTLYMQEYAPFWEVFFKKLGYSVILSTSKEDFLQKGKEIAGAEFCAPISLWHGHIQDLTGQVDYLFAPHMFLGEDTDSPKFYCYYSNYAVALVQNIDSLNLKHRCISPVIDFSKPAIENIHQIYESLPHELKFNQTPNDIKVAYTDAWRWFSSQRKSLVEIFKQEIELSDDISVVLMGRPYLMLDPVMNKNIPQKFNELGVKTFVQDMLPLSDINFNTPAREVIDWNHWKYGAHILHAAEYSGRTANIYPVLLTAFKCSPDSFVISYFKEIIESYRKPYLVLQIDEHGSDVGYETRIESAVRSFRNHFHEKKSAVQIAPTQSVSTQPLKNHTILIPNYDSLSCSFISAAFHRAGYQTRLIEETPTTVISSLRLNDGQCLPISSIAQGAMETIQKYELRPERTAIFLNAITRMACNLPQYPLMAKKLLEQRGEGFENVQIFATQFDMKGMPLEVIYDVYCSYLIGGLLRRIGCKLRPHERYAGQTDQVIEQSHKKMYACIANGRSKENMFRKIIAEFSKIPLTAGPRSRRPKVSIIGDLYVRDNDVFNQQLISELEMHGAEVVTTPYTYIVRMLAVKRNYEFFENGHYFSMIRDKLLREVLETFEKRFYKIAHDILDEEFPTFNEEIFDSLKKYNLSFKHGGETTQNLVKIFSLLKHYPDIVLFIHVNPIFCCPALVSESIFKKVEKDIGIPIISIVYDGTAATRNEILAPYLHYITEEPLSMALP